MQGSRRAIGIGSLMVAAAIAGTAFAFSDMSEEERAAREAAQAEQAAASAEAEEYEERTIYDGVYTVEQRDAGRALYAKHCVTCHGAHLRGSPGGPRIVGPVLNDKYDGAPLSAYYDYVRYAMPKGQIGSLTEQQYVDVIAFVLSVHGAPAGEARLEPDADLLDSIIIGPKPE